MVGKHRDEEGEIGIVKAIETLSDIAEVDIDRDISISDIDQLAWNENAIPVGWLKEQNGPEIAKTVKEIFRVVLKYLRNFYRKEYGQQDKEKSVEEIKTIMVLVGDAAKKLDRLTTIFHKKISKSFTDFKEYRELQEFYLTRIARKVDERVLSRWIMKLAQTTFEKSRLIKGEELKHIDTKHVFIDLDSVKRDTEYELFFLRKEDGTRFFNPRLIRNVKLVCDFGGYVGGKKQDDPLVSSGVWSDRFYHETAKNIYDAMHRQVDLFYKEAIRYKNQELVGCVNKAIMALMLSANSHNLMRYTPVKSCQEYFVDFQKFLRAAVENREYLRWEAFAPENANKASLCLMETIQALCYSLYSKNRGLQNLKGEFTHLIKEAVETRAHDHAKGGSLTHCLSADYAAMGRLMAHHPNGPLTKVLNLLEDGEYLTFDPLMQGNLPMHLFSLKWGNEQIQCLRYPTPMVQEFIHKPSIIEEYKAFIRVNHDLEKTTHLIFNLQDKTAWREHHRSHGIESFANSSDFEKLIFVVTLPKDTEFYHQEPPYDQDHRFDLFMEHFMGHLQEEGSGFYFPQGLKKELFPKFAEDLMHGVHQAFFSGKNVLSKDQRLDFIELYYLFLELKVIELIKPGSLCFSCKDGIDQGVTSSALLFGAIDLYRGDQLNPSHWEQMRLILYGPSLLQRERLIIPADFHRFLNALKVIQNLKEEWGQEVFVKQVMKMLAPLFSLQILDASIIV